MAPDAWHTGEEPERLIPWTVRGAFGRIAASGVLSAAWLSATLVYLAFYAHGWTLVQEIVAGVVSVLILLAALVLLWVSFGVQLARRWVDW